MSERYPELSEAGKEEAQVLFDKFRDRFKKIADEVLGELYIEIAPHIETDSWQNYRNALMDGFKDYKNRLVHDEYNFKEIRDKIYAEHRTEIIKDLDQDNLKRIDDLNKEISRLRDMINERPHGRY